MTQNLFEKNYKSRLHASSMTGNDIEKPKLAYGSAFIQECLWALKFSIPYFSH